MKLKKISFVLFAFLTANLAQAEAYDSQFTLSLDLLGQNAFASSGLGSSMGVGGSFFAEWRPLPFASMGTGLDFTSHSSAGGWQTSSWNLGGRIFPIPSDRGGELYLQGSWGLNLITTSYRGTWPGSFHGSAGLGYRAFMDKSNALDLGFQYDFYSPLRNPMSAVGAKVGWTFLFGETPLRDKEAYTARSQANPIASPSTLSLAPETSSKTKIHHPKKTKKKKMKLETAPSPSPFIVYSWVEGDQLESLAEAFLGRGNLYPLIVDANRAALGSPAGLVKGVSLNIPDKPTEEQKDAARAKADQPEYRMWAQVGKPF